MSIFSLFIDFLKMALSILALSIFMCFVLNISTLCLDMHKFVTIKESIGITLPIMFIGYILSIFNRMR